jgi:hypothetical protein
VIDGGQGEHVDHQAGMGGARTQSVREVRATGIKRKNGKPSMINVIMGQ